MSADAESRVQEVMRLADDYAAWAIAVDREGGSHVNVNDARAALESAVRALAEPAEVEALRKDAERYRWLRTQHWNNADLCVVANPKVAVRLGHDCPSLERLDAAIDAAMAAESQEQPK